MRPEETNEVLMNIMRITGNLWNYESIAETIDGFCREMCSLDVCTGVVVYDDSGHFCKSKDQSMFSCRYLDYRPRTVKIIYTDECDCGAVKHRALIMCPYGKNGVVYIFTSTVDESILTGLNYAAVILSRVLEDINVRNKFKKTLHRLENNIYHFQYLADRLRNPLSTIIGATEVRGEIPENKVFEMIAESARRIWNVLDRLGDSEVKTRKIFEIEKEKISNPRRGRQQIRREIKIKLPVLNLKIQSGKSVLLERIPETFRAKVLVTKWMEYLIKRTGSGVEDVLKYYTEVGWISDEVMGELLKYIRGLKIDKTRSSKMEIKDHLVSLIFIDMIKRTENLKNTLVH